MQPRQLAFAIGKAGGRFDLGVHDRARPPPVLRGSGRVVLVAAGLDGDEHDVAQQRAIAAHRHEIPIGECGEQSRRRGFGDPHHDQPAALVQRVVSDRVLPLRRAMVARKVLVRQERDHPRAGLERGVHALHEVAVGEVPLLEDDGVPGVLENATDFGGERRVRAGAADEEIR